MKQLLKIASLFCFMLLFSCGNDAPFPVSEWNSNSEKPIIFYLSGDGGFNTFSQTMGRDLHALGYDVFALNTKHYFWQKKTPKEASKDTEKFLKKIIKKRKNKKIILVGYSYGAEIAPFIYNRFDDNFKKNISKLIIIGPTEVNDFQIHVDQYVYEPVQYGYSVVKEINKIKNLPLTIVLSDDENGIFPTNKITVKNFQFLHIKGTHDYSLNTKMLADAISKYF